MPTTHPTPAGADRLSRIGPRSAGVSMTPEEFDALAPRRFDDRFRYELVHGVLVVTPPPGAGERGPNDLLGYLLNAYQETHPLGSSLDATLPEQTVVTPGGNRRRADRAVWAGAGRVPDPSKDRPAILVEFVSRSRRDAVRDYERKRDEYLAAGVKEYWVVDRFRRVMTVYRPGAAGPTDRVVAEGQTYQTDLLPGFDLPLARLLERADQWDRTRPQRARKPPAGETDG